MSNIDKRALREAADAANETSWGRWESYHPHKGARGYEVKVGVKAIAQHCLKVDSVFIAAANPVTVLALLDELEAAEKRIAELQIARDKCFMSGLKTGWEYGIADDTEGYNREIDDAQTVIDRAAMLQAEPVSNSDELPLDYLQGHKDGLEWAAQLAEANHPQTGDWLYDDPTELAKAIRKGPDMPFSDGNSPVIQDGWVLVPKELACEMDDAAWDAYHETRSMSDIWAALLSAAPQQEE